MEDFTRDRSPALYYYVESGYSVAVREGRLASRVVVGAKKQSEEKYADQRSTKIIKRLICYKKQRKYYSFVFLL